MATNDSFIDILTVIDAKSLMDDYAANPGTKDFPTTPANPAKYMYMLVKRSEANNMEAQPELSVAVKTGDVVNWRATSMTTNTSLATLLYRMHISQGDDLVTAPAPIGPVQVDVPDPVTDGNVVSSIGTQRFYDFYFQATAVRPGSPGMNQVTYQQFIMLTDNQGNPVGYFGWDPYLTITQS